MAKGGGGTRKKYHRRVHLVRRELPKKDILQRW